MTATPTDVGTVTALVNGVQSTYTWGAGDSASSIAHNLATAITANSGGQITATPSGSCPSPKYYRAMTLHGFHVCNV
jgi:phage tail sheath gpL-like